MDPTAVEGAAASRPRAVVQGVPDREVEILYLRGADDLGHVVLRDVQESCRLSAGERFSYVSVRVAKAVPLLTLSLLMTVMSDAAATVNDK